MAAQRKTESRYQAYVDGTRVSNSRGPKASLPTRTRARVAARMNAPHRTCNRGPLLAPGVSRAGGCSTGAPRQRSTYISSRTLHGSIRSGGSGGSGLFFCQSALTGLKILYGRFRGIYRQARFSSAVKPSQGFKSSAGSASGCYDGPKSKWRANRGARRDHSNPYAINAV
jgi:hypothetical protein